MKKLLCTLLFSVFTIGIVNAQADINVQGNSVTIVSGDTTPDVADDTDFGQAGVGSSLTKIYTIENTGTATLFLSLPPGLTGSADFSILVDPDFSIPAGNSSTFEVQYTASAVGVVTGTVSIISNDGDAAENPYTFDIQAEGIAATDPDINIQGNSTDIISGDTTPSLADDTDFGQISIGGTITKTYTIQNTGVSDLFISLPPGLTGSSDFSVASNPAFLIVPAGSSTFDIDFTPTAVGVVTGTVSITSNDPDESPYTFDIQAEGTAVNEPDITILGNGVTISDGDTTPSTTDDTDFGQVNIGAALTRTYTIENEGAQTLFVSAPSLTGSADFSVTGSPAFSVAPGATTTFDIEFTPSGTGVVTSTISISSNDPDAENPYTFDIQGEGVVLTEADINVQGNAIDIADGDTTPSTADNTDFGTINLTTSSTVTYTIENTGTATLFVGTPSLTGSADFSITANPAFSVAPGGSTTFDVQYAPTAIGAASAEVSIPSNDPDTENPYTFAIQGEGIPANQPEIDIQGLGNSIANGDTTPSVTDDTDFGQTDISSGSVSHTFTIFNTGDIDLNLTGTSPFVTISGANAADFSVTVAPSSVITTAGSTTFIITYNPAVIGVGIATISIANDDTDENPYTFDIQGEGIDASVDSPLMISQYYEGTSSINNWIEVKNISTNPTIAGSYNLALFLNSNGTIGGGIATNNPDEFVAIPALAAGEVVIFRRTSATLPSAGNLGSGSIVETEVCTFTGDDIIVISTSSGANTYNDRIDIVGVVGNTAAVDWGTDISIIKGCGTVEQASTTYNSFDYLELTLEEVNNADPNTNIALGTQTVGSTTWTTGWSNGIPDRTKETIVNGTYSNADGSFESCNLTINPGSSINLDSGGTGSNYVFVDGNLAINGSFTIGDTESLVMSDPDALISGTISKIERTTPLNNFRDYTYWSSPVSTTIASAFAGVDPNRIFRWRTPSNGDTGNWEIASGSMEEGRGYLAEAPTSVTTGQQHQVTFTGTPNNGLVDVPVGIDLTNGDGYGGYNIIGNPYPSAIDIDLFLKDQANIEINNSDVTTTDATIWLWTHGTAISNEFGENTGEFTAADYATYNLVGGVGSGNDEGTGVTPTNIIGSGQGFLIRVLTVGNNEVTFENSMRVRGQNDTQFFKSGKATTEKDRIWLNMSSVNTKASNQILVGFMEDATDGVDRGYDGLHLGSGNVIFYSNLEDNIYAIQGLGAFDQSKEVSLGFYSGLVETHKISIGKAEGILADEDVYLVDNELNIVHDLKEGDYEFDVTAAGNFKNRFTLKFNSGVLSTDDLELNNSFIVYSENGELKIKASDEISKLKVYDMTGRLLIDSEPKSAVFDVESQNVKVGTVLILNATMKNGSVVSKKAIKY